MATNFTILVDAEIQNINQLNNQLKNLKIDPLSLNVDSRSLKTASQNVENLGLNFNQANEIFRTSIDLIGSIVDQVFEMNDALTEFQKVSDYTGESLDNYVEKLTQMGDEVARTGKPWCLSRGDGMVNQHREQFKIQ